MTFGRAIVVAGMAALFSHASEPGEVILILAVGWLCWQFTTDPLPQAVRSGLRQFADEWRGR